MNTTKALQQPPMKKHVVRIVGGEYRRTPIPVIDQPGLRPTPDRVRETLFNWLQHFWASDFTDKRVLDLFAGTGALGFEAASRGVAHVQMVENNPLAVASLRSLRSKLKADHIRIHQGSATQVLQRLNNTPFDLILLDPPFDQGWIARLWPSLPELLSPTGLVYIESEAPLPEQLECEILRQARAGQVHFYLIRFAAMQKTDNNRDTQT